MASINRFTQTQNPRYNPRTLQDMLIAPQAMRQQHDAVTQGAVNVETALGQLDYDNIHAGAVESLSTEFENSVNNIVESLSSKGFTEQSKRDLMKLNSEFTNASGPKGLFGQAEAWKKNYLETADGIRKDAKHYNPADVERYIHQGYLEAKRKFDETGNISAFNLAGTPEYLSIVDSVNEVTKQIGSNEWEETLVDNGYSVGLDEATGKLVFKTMSGSIVNKTNSKQLDHAADILANIWFNPDGRGFQSNTIQNMDPQYILEQLNDYLGLKQSTSVRDSRRANYQFSNPIAESTSKSTEKKDKPVSPAMSQDYMSLNIYDLTGKKTLSDARDYAQGIINNPNVNDIGQRNMAMAVSERAHAIEREFLESSTYNNLPDEIKNSPEELKAFSDELIEKYNITNEDVINESKKYVDNTSGRIPLNYAMMDALNNWFKGGSSNLEQEDLVRLKDINGRVNDLNKTLNTYTNNQDEDFGLTNTSEITVYPTANFYGENKNQIESIIKTGVFDTEPLVMMVKRSKDNSNLFEASNDPKLVNGVKSAMQLPYNHSRVNLRYGKINSTNQPALIVDFTDESNSKDYQMIYPVNQLYNSDGTMTLGGGAISLAPDSDVARHLTEISSSNNIYLIGQDSTQSIYLPIATEVLGDAYAASQIDSRVLGGKYSTSIPGFDKITILKDNGKVTLESTKAINNEFASNNISFGDISINNNDFDKINKSIENLDNEYQKEIRNIIGQEILKLDMEYQLSGMMIKAMNSDHMNKLSKIDNPSIIELAEIMSDSKVEFDDLVSAKKALEFRDRLNNIINNFVSNPQNFN